MAAGQQYSKQLNYDQSNVKTPSVYDATIDEWMMLTRNYVYTGALWAPQKASAGGKAEVDATLTGSKVIKEVVLTTLLQSGASALTNIVNTEDLGIVGLGLEIQADQPVKIRLIASNDNNVQKALLDVVVAPSMSLSNRYDSNAIQEIPIIPVSAKYYRWRIENIGPAQLTVCNIVQKSSKVPVKENVLIKDWIAYNKEVRDQGIYTENRNYESFGGQKRIMIKNGLDTDVTIFFDLYEYNTTQFAINVFQVNIPAGGVAYYTYADFPVLSSTIRVFRMYHKCYTAAPTTGALSIWLEMTQ